MKHRGGYVLQVAAGTWREASLLDAINARRGARSRLASINGRWDDSN